MLKNIVKNLHIYIYIYIRRLFDVKTHKILTFLIFQHDCFIMNINQLKC